MSDSHEPSRYLSAEWVAYLNDEGEEVKRLDCCGLYI